MSQPVLPAAIQYLVGIDGGGSNTRARLTDRDGRLLGEGTAGASALGQGIAQAWAHIQLAIARAVQASAVDGLPPPDMANTALGIGISGFNNPVWQAEFLAANPGYGYLRLDSDAFTALLGAHQGQPGVLMIIGTGNNAQALHPDGRRAWAGGWGFPSGDEGSGAVLGLQAVNLAQQSLDGRRAPSALTEAVVAATGGSAQSLLEWCGHAGQFEYATLAPCVFDCEQQDPAAAQLLQTAVQAIEQHVQALDPDGRLPVALSGSIGQRLAPRLAPALQARLRTAVGDAMDGALALCTLSS